MRLIEYKDRHELPDEDAVAIFDHIPKTGGITLVSALASHYGAEGFRRIDGPELLDFCSNQSLDNGIRCMAGHAMRGIHAFLPASKKAFYFTWIRHPLEWVVSAVKQAYRLQSAFSDNDDLAGTITRYLLGRHAPNFFVGWLGNGDPGLAEEVLFERRAFFGIAELYAESVRGLSALLPWLKGETIISRNMAPEDGITPDPKAVAYFLERNSKDVELYDKALKVFNNRLPPTQAPSHDIVIGAGEQSPSADQTLHVHTTHASVEAMRAGGYVPDPAEQFIWSIYITLNEASDEYWETFHEYVAKFDLPSCKVYACISALRLGKMHEADIYGTAVFDIMDELDRHNQTTSIIRLRLDMIKRLIDCAVPSGKDGFPARCLDWLSALAATPRWIGVAFRTEALLREKLGELAVACDCARKAVAIDRDYAPYQETLSRLLLASGALDEVGNEAL